MNALVPLPATAAFEATSAELFTAHDTGVEAVALVHDPKLPWVVPRAAGCRRSLSRGIRHRPKRNAPRSG